MNEPGVTIVPKTRKASLLAFGAKWHIAALACCVIAALAALFARTVADPDLWGHLRFGQDLLRTGQVIRPDPYSYMTGDQTWINHEWLAEGIFALAYRVAGPQGLIGLKLLAALSICGLIYAYLRDLHLAPLRAWILVLLGTIPIYVGLGTVRPHLFTYVCFALLMFILSQAERGRLRWLWGLPLLFALWPNLHGGFLAGIGILLLWLLIYLLEFVLRRPRLPATPQPAPWTALAAVALALLATLVNPYGIGLWTFLLRTATIPRPEITEWAPLTLVSIPGGVYLVLLFVGIAGFVLSPRPRRPFAILAFTVLALLPLVASRHLPLFAVAMPFLAGPYVADVWERWSASRRSASGDAGSHPLFRAALTGVFMLGTDRAPRPGRQPSPVHQRRSRDLSGTRRRAADSGACGGQHGRKLRLGGVCDLAPGSNRARVVRWPPRDGLLGARIRARCQLPVRLERLGCSAEEGRGRDGAGADATASLQPLKAADRLGGSSRRPRDHAFREAQLSPGRTHQGNGAAGTPAAGRWAVLPMTHRLSGSGTSGVDFLLRASNPDGGWVYAVGQPSCVEATAAAGWRCVMSGSRWTTAAPPPAPAVTLGQPDAGSPASGGTFSLRVGFWRQPVYRTAPAGDWPARFERGGAPAPDLG